MKYFTNIHKNKTYNFIIRLGIIAATYYFIYSQIFHKKKLEYVVDSFLELIDQPFLYFFIVWISMLMIVNWGIEALKWQFLIGKIEKISFFKARVPMNVSSVLPVIHCTAVFMRTLYPAG